MRREPDNPKPRNNLAWLLASRPGVSPDDCSPGRRAGEAGRGDGAGVGVFWNTLGVACYRAGDDAAAIAAFDRSMRLRSGGDANDWFFLAMIHHREERRDVAREWYDRAVAWMKAHPASEPEGELSRFHAEAARSLAIDRHNPD